MSKTGHGVDRAAPWGAASRRFAAACLAIVAALAIGGCSKDDPDPPACTPGDEGCACAAGNECQPTNAEGTALICSDEGFCVADTAVCPEGAEGCACYDDGTCDLLDGIAMSCIGDLCQATVVPPEGTLGGACHTDGTCDAVDDGTLVCVDGVCELAGCPSGTIGCPCGPMGACDDEGARCGADGLCELGACTPGTALCTCDDGACDDTLECVDDLCRLPNTLAITATGGDARACDVRITTTGREVDTAVFPEGVRGHLERRDEEAAIALIRTQDTALRGVIGTITLVGDAVAGAEDVSVLEVRCFDRDGSDDPQITLDLR